MRAIVVAPLLASLAVACGSADDQAAPSSIAASSPRTAAVTSERLIAADAEPGQWLSHGRTYGEQRFSPLAEIDTRNVGELGLAWYGDFGVPRAQESTPLFVDGVLYVTTAWSNVKAYDARSGIAALEFRRERAGRMGQPRVLRRREPRRRSVERQGLRRHASTAACSRSTRRPARSHGKPTRSCGATSPTRSRARRAS